MMVNDNSMFFLSFQLFDTCVRYDLKVQTARGLLSGCFEAGPTCRHKHASIIYGLRHNESVAANVCSLLKNSEALLNHRSGSFLDWKASANQSFFRLSEPLKWGELRLKNKYFQFIWWTLWQADT